MKRKMLNAHCRRLFKDKGKAFMIKTIRMIDFYDKGKAEENIYYLKEQREKLRALRQKMKEMEGSLDQSIEALEKVAGISAKLKDNMFKKKEPKK